MNDLEQEWLERARAGEQAAFGLLVESYHRPVVALTYRMLGDLPEAEDAAQEAFLRAYSRLHQYQPHHKFSTWLFSIANYHCIDILRRRRMQFVGLEESSAVFRLESSSDRPEEEALAQEQAEEMQALVNQLAPDYRTPLVLRYWNDCSYQEIADVMDISVAAVKSRLFRARKKLASLYETAQQSRSAPLPKTTTGTARENDNFDEKQFDEKQFDEKQFDEKQPAVSFESKGRAEEVTESWQAKTHPLTLASAGSAGL